MSFVKYQHVERFGTVEVRGIEEGPCHIFPKLDGANGSVWYQDDQVHCGSRNQHLNGENGLQGFKQYIQNHEGHQSFGKDYPHLRLYGEWLVPHTLKTYRPDAWRRFYVFDVCYLDEEEGRTKYMSYEEYKPLMKRTALTLFPVLQLSRMETRSPFANGQSGISSS